MGGSSGGVQMEDQKLTHGNKALSLNRLSGQSVRVIRGWKEITTRQ
eukprot:gene12668-10861_t